MMPVSPFDISDCKTREELSAKLQAVRVMAESKNDDIAERARETEALIEDKIREIDE